VGGPREFGVACALRRAAAGAAARSLAVLAPGFWLSFGAVAVILYVATGRLRVGQSFAPGRASRMAIAWFNGARPVGNHAGTGAAAAGLVPADVAVSPLANAVAIPLVSLV